MIEQPKNSRANTPRRKKALLATIVSTALLVTFATYTLLKTDFKTYPAKRETVSERSSQTQPLSPFSPSISLEREQEAVVTETSFEQILPAEDPEELNKIDEELVSLREQKLAFEDELKQREAEICYLHEELDAAKREIDALSQPKEERRADESLQRELAGMQNRVQQYQDSQLLLESRSESLQKRNEELSKELALSENRCVELQEQIDKDRERVLAQDRSFDKLTNALKSHKEAMRRMDRARVELAGELDATKQQYTKLLQMVALKERESSTQREENRTTEPLEKEEAQYHTVTQGETLTSISKKYYGSSKRWREIYEANPSVLGDHNHLKVGLVLVIP